MLPFVNQLRRLSGVEKYNRGAIVLEDAIDTVVTVCLFELFSDARTIRPHK